ncbi:hypothetical protein L0152_22590 [bacterium]|nr:hypothetical protein [bacterium]
MVRRTLFVIFMIMLLQTAQSALPVKFAPPTGVVQVSECVPGQGVHWAKQSDMPLGPIYVEANGELIAIEYMISQSDFTSGKSFQNLKFFFASREIPIDHMDIGFLPQGHPGFEAPHYDLHFYMVPHTRHAGFRCL